LSTVFIPDDESLVITIGGQHQTGMSNAQVTRVFVVGSSIPFVIRSIFTTFINLREYHFINSQFPTRIQANSFLNASSLTHINYANTLLNEINPNVFQGASNLQVLLLANNQLTTLGIGALNGLGTLTTIDISSNRINVLSDQAFLPVPLIQSINLSGNTIVRLPSFLFSTNLALTSLVAQNNQIDQIGNRILDNLTNLRTLSLSGNTCVNQNWVNIGTGGTTKDSIRAVLTPCFNNYRVPVTNREFGLRLRGQMRLFDMDGNIVGVL
jgi:hypothetical protein